MATRERVDELVSRRWLSRVDQRVIEFLTDPKFAKYDWWEPLDWRGQRWSGIEAEGRYFVRAKLWKTDLSHGRMNYADFTEADLAGGSLHKSKLAGATFRDAVLAAVDLRRADLTNADLTNADLAHAQLQGADLADATLDGADISGAVFADDQAAAVGLTQAQLDRARAEPDEPPILGNAADAQTGAPLTWPSAQPDAQPREQ